MSIFTSIAALLQSSDVPNIPTNSANDVLNAGLNLTYFVGGVVAVIVIIISGIRLVTNNGEPETLKKARDMIVYAVIGLVVILAAFTITWFFIGRFK
jgi:multisubunit Na+/H+ antiporter MnhB subunit